MKIQGVSKKFPLVMANRFLLRLRGNMGKKKIETVLFFPNCRSIHTFFMRTKIDVVMINKQYEVQAVFPKLKTYRILFPRQGVWAVIEFPNQENPYQKGDIVQIEKE